MVRLVSAAFAVFSLIAVLSGCLAAHLSDVPPSVWARNPIVWLVGLGAAVALSRADADRAARILLLLTIVALIATLASDGLSGVHRWIDLGPVRLNGAQVFLPVAVVALAQLGARHRWAWLSAPIAAALLAAQPDASQAAGFAAAVLALLAVLRPPRLEGLAAGVGCVLAAAVAWIRPDPLAPVAEVEGIIGLAARVSPMLAVAAVLALAGASSAPLGLSRNLQPLVRAAAVALGLYFALTALAPAFGAFPVPLVGMGVSPILGGWLGIGLLAGLARSRNAPAPQDGGTFT